MATIETATLGQEREIAYNAYLASLDSTEVRALCRARLGDRFQTDYLDTGTKYNPSDSLELYLHDMFVAGAIQEDCIGAEILDLLGELV